MIFVSLTVCACSDSSDPAGPAGASAGDPTEAAAAAGEVVSLPFAVREGAERLLITYADAEGAYRRALADGIASGIASYLRDR